LKGPVEREWVLHAPDPALVHELSLRHGLTAAAAKALVNRGVTDPLRAATFLRGGLSDLPDPFLLQDAEKAAGRLADAGSRGEPILIYADYDADGATGAACLYLFLRELFPQLPVTIHQNDRVRDGYGLRERVLAEASTAGFRLVVTVDCGISDIGAIRGASGAGMDVIVTDHHLPGEKIPEAFAVVDPRRPECGYPEKELAGVGVAFLLACGVRRALRERGFFDGRDEPSMRRFLDLVALGTVADMASLAAGNRPLVREGIREIRRAPRPGIEALFSVSGASTATATELDLGFRVGPRLNAAGRIGDATRSYRILVSSSAEEAGRLARELNEDNGRRQREQERILAAVVAGIDRLAELPPAIVLSDAAWHQGVLGIVASKILDRYGRPVVLLHEDAGDATGSCRSLDGFPIVSALAELSPLLTRFGGHAQAAGVSLPLANLDAFRTGLSGIAARHAAVAPFVLRREIDSEIGFDDVGLPLLADLELLRPFGTGNPEPGFLLRNARIARTSRVGGGHHLRFEAERGGRRLEGIAFYRSDIPVDGSGRADLLVAVQENLYRGVRSAHLVLRDARAAGGPLLCGEAMPR
jgi:single-stranded-DNA-specific exonuclease